MAAFTPPITLLPIACEALTRPCDLIRARAKAAPATVRALLRFMGRGDPCFAAASMGLGSRGLPRPAPTSSSVPLSDIQGSRIQGFFARQAKQTRENDNPRIQTDPTTHAPVPRIMIDFERLIYKANRAVITALSRAAEGL